MNLRKLRNVCCPFMICLLVGGNFSFVSSASATPIQDLSAKNMVKTEEKCFLGSNDACVSPFEEIFDEEICLAELDHCDCNELKSIISSLSLENPVSDVLFLGKYKVFVLENPIPWQKSIGDIFKFSIVMYAVKVKKFTKVDSTSDDVFSNEILTDDSGNPLLIKFDSILRQESVEKRSISILKQLNMLYNIYSLSYSLARRLLFLCSTIENSLKFPFITVCHGATLKTAFLYGSYVQENKAFHLKIENQGNISSLEALPSMQSLKTTHLEGFANSLISGNCIGTLVSAHYEFLDCKRENSSLIPVKNSSISVDCSWSKAQSVLEPLPLECITTAKIKTVAGDEETGVFLKYKEIKLLKALQLSLKTGVMSWMNLNSSSQVETEIQALVNEERNMVNIEECSEIFESDLEHLENIIVFERIPLSFPDKLWLILRRCSSFEQLIEAIKYIYKAFTDIFLSPPATCSNDLSTISKDINNMQSITCPDLNYEKASELLLEIGVEKMRRDYFEFFIKLGLVPQELFNQFTQANLLSHEAVAGLEKLHSVLELILLCIKQLNLPKGILSDFARNFLKHYTSIPEVDLQHVFILHIPTIFIRPVLDQMRPTVWEISLFSSDENFKKQTNHRFVTTATDNHIYAPKDYHPKLMLKGASYNYSLGTLIEKSLLPYTV